MLFVLPSLPEINIRDWKFPLAFRACVALMPCLIDLQVRGVVLTLGRDLLVSGFLVLVDRRMVAYRAVFLHGFSV